METELPPWPRAATIVGLLGAICLAWGLARGAPVALRALDVWAHPYHREDVTRARAGTVRSAALLHLAVAPGGCPSVSDLLSEGFFHSDEIVSDGWGNRFGIVCDGFYPRVVSDRFDGEHVLTAAGARKWVRAAKVPEALSSLLR